MHPWILLALLAPLLFAVTNFIDKYLISKITEHNSVGAILILDGIVVLPFLAVLGLAVHSSLAGYSLGSTLGALFSGVILIAAYALYYKSLAIADASLVASLFQLIVVFNYLLGLIILNEQLSAIQLLSVAIIILCTTLLTVESKGQKLRLNHSVLLYMALSSLLIALSDVSFKYVAKATAYWPTQFYSYAGATLVGLGIFTFSRSARRGFLTIVRTRARRAFTVGSLNEIFNISGIISLRYAMLIAPIALVQALSSAQTLYLLVLGVLLTHLFPRAIRENIDRRHLFKKAVAILTLVLGATLLALNS